ncbi:MAG: alpha-hydroxy acid oxidase [Henriciella sp.]
MNTVSSVDLVWRRSFLRWLALSTVACGTGLVPGCGVRDDGEIDEAAALWLESQQGGYTRNTGLSLSNADMAANVYELRTIAQQQLPPAHFMYLEAAAGAGETERENRRAFEQYSIRSQRLHGIDQPDLSVDIMGERWSSPIALSPAGSQKAFHRDGELATAEGVKRARGQMILSSLSTQSIEDVTEKLGFAPWFQLYVLNKESHRQKILARVQSAGAETIVVTVDDIGGRGSENYIIGMRGDERDCGLCHDTPRTVAGHARRKPMLSAFADEPKFDLGMPGMNWEFLARLRDQISGKMVVKGILTPQDAERCVELGADAIFVSNHGGRVSPNGEATLTALPEIAAAVGGAATVLLDSGVRRGSDVFTALALGADAVCIGRPYLWGLGAFGADGVERTLGLLNAELKRMMIQAGAASVQDIKSQSIRRKVLHR